MNFTQDLAIVEIANNPNLLNKCITFNGKYHEITHHDIRSEKNVTIVSRPNSERVGSNIRDAFVIDYNINYDVKYNGKPYTMKNIILLADSPNVNICREVSLPGDSGSCVYFKVTNKFIGILIGGNGKFSFVMPIKEILEKNNFKLI